MWLLCGPVTLNKHSINKLDLYQLVFRWSRRRCSAGRLAYWLCRKHNSVVWLSYCWCFFLSLCATICFRPRVRLRSRRFVSHRAVHSCEQEEVQVLVIWQQWYSWDLYLSLLFFLTTGQVSELVSYTVNTAGCVGATSLTSACYLQPRSLHLFSLWAAGSWREEGGSQKQILGCFCFFFFFIKYWYQPVSTSCVQRGLFHITGLLSKSVLNVDTFRQQERIVDQKKSIV